MIVTGVNCSRCGKHFVAAMRRRGRMYCSQACQRLANLERSQPWPAIAQAHAVAVEEAAMIALGSLELRRLAREIVLERDEFRRLVVVGNASRASAALLRSEALLDTRFALMRELLAGHSVVVESDQR